MSNAAAEGAPAAGAGGPRPPSRVARLARLARDTALAVEGVANATSGPRGVWATPDRDDPVPGVVATAQRDGYDLSLHLVAEPVPLHPLAEQVRERVRARAEEALPDVRLGPIAVAFEDVAEPPASAAGAAAARSPGGSAQTPRAPRGKERTGR